MLKIEQLHAGYGKGRVLRGVTLELGAGEIVALLGRNGSGRSTTARAIMGLVEAQGSLRWRGQEILGKKTFEIARLGIGYVPEGRDVFPTLSVAHNLLLGQKHPGRPGRWSVADVYRMFPALQQRAQTPAGLLSGGEQQLLSLCRSLMGDPDLLIVDEPTEGLAPQMVELLAQYLTAFRARGMSVLLIEQKLTMALAISDRCAVMGHGQLVFTGTPAALQVRSDIRREWLEV